MSNNLNEITYVRFLKGDKNKRQKYMKKFKDKWDNDSHFIRAAVNNFYDYLDGKYQRKMD